MTTTIHTPATEMPETIIGTDGRTYHRTRYTGTTLPACRFGEGHTSHEYWAFEEGYEEDTFRLHAITATQFWLD
ncbi:MAG: hypothetical protein J0L76_20465 [Rhodobacterales bacterium]|nr:hypothetical protein [Rhodobacterales bacterium]